MKIADALYSCAEMDNLSFLLAKHGKGDNKLMWHRSLRISLYERAQQHAKATEHRLQVHVDKVVKATRDA